MAKSKTYRKGLKIENFFSKPKEESIGESEKYREGKLRKIH